MSKQLAWPADKVERRKVASLVPYARNARTHSAEQVDQLAASIREWGWTVPVIIDEDGGLIAGHGRVMAAKKLGIEDVPVVVAKGWSEAKKQAYVIADNKLPLNAGWDMDLLKIEMQDIDAAGLNLELTGFGLGEISALFDAPNFEPGSEADQGKLDELSPKIIQCPHCGQDFDARKHGG